MPVVSEDAARHAGLDLSSFDAHEAPVRGREEPVIVYAVPNLTIVAESIAISTRYNGISDEPVV